ncbi:FkbM family methyltransferase [Pseudooceanicola sediminis]|uniref:FkbM family methyltransferase n=1 Tax=Pseudooceanicola sediminis TaxID=2211117 RepID=A0A399J4X5_9RHOB|nr:FkbM family methyltransferase [Pseudooceanicola sediminis]RII37896.1 FkbM family methyltransferase [Pseudooceanicola sediminis]|tara:strand:+ start:25552 stop:26259 length:708 start_codon:yes stop_codon:yes gene_type:complete
MNTATDIGMIIHGIRLPITSEDVSPIIWQALESGKYEAKEARQVRKLLHTGDRVLELGAGIGVITAVMAQTPGVTIWSFDANPHTIELAERVAAANEIDNVTFRQGLLMSGAPETHSFYVRRDFWMSSMIESQGPYEDVIDIGSQNLEAFIAEHEVNVLVMDIEGAERDLLAAADLDGIDRVFMELHDHLYGLAGVRDIFASMNGHGFSYDPRNSSGPCVMFTRDDGTPRTYCEE